METKEAQIDRLETIAEEVRMYLGLDAKVENGRIEIDTIAGKMFYSPSEKTVMGDVYRIISNYGAKLHSWGLKMKLNEAVRTLSTPTDKQSKV